MKPKGLFAALSASAQPDQGKKRSRLMLAVSLLLAALFLYLALRGLNWATFFSALVKAQYAYLPPVFLWISLTYLLRAARWRLLVQTGTLHLLDVFWVNMAGYLGNNILPARAGELVRAVYLGKISGISVSFVLATCLVERVVDVVALIIFGSISLLSLNMISPSLQVALEIMIIIGIAGLSFILLLPRLRRLTSVIVASGISLGIGSKRLVNQNKKPNLGVL